MDQVGCMGAHYMATQDAPAFVGKHLAVPFGLIHGQSLSVCPVEGFVRSESDPAGLAVLFGETYGGDFGSREHRCRTDVETDAVLFAADVVECPATLERSIMGQHNAAGHVAYRIDAGDIGAHVPVHRYATPAGFHPGSLEAQRDGIRLAADRHQHGVGFSIALRILLHILHPQAVRCLFDRENLSGSLY